MMSFLLLFVLSGSLLAGEDDGFKSIFDGKTLDGWVVRSGFAKYHVDDGAIVGTTVKGSPNTFLCTEKEFGDFILEFEVKVDPRLNSGVQIRSHVSDENVVFGYQVEVAPTRVVIGPDQDARAAALDDEDPLLLELQLEVSAQTGVEPLLLGQGRQVEVDQRARVDVDVVEAGADGLGHQRLDVAPGPAFPQRGEMGQESLLDQRVGEGRERHDDLVDAVPVEVARAVDAAAVNSQPAWFSSVGEVRLAVVE